MVMGRTVLALIAFFDSVPVHDGHNIKDIAIPERNRISRIGNRLFHETFQRVSGNGLAGMMPACEENCLFANARLTDLYQSDIAKASTLRQNTTGQMWIGSVVCKECIEIFLQIRQCYREPHCELIRCESVRERIRVHRRGAHPVPCFAVIVAHGRALIADIDSTVCAANIYGKNEINLSRLIHCCFKTPIEPIATAAKIGVDMNRASRIVTNQSIAAREIGLYGHCHGGRDRLVSCRHCDILCRHCYRYC